MLQAWRSDKVPKIDIKKAELVWIGKYDEDGKIKPVEKTGPYPFQIVEVVNKPRTGKEEPQQSLFEIWEGEEGETFEDGWKNKLIWGDNKLVISSLLEKFAGKINLIYIDPPFATGADFKVKIKVGEESDEITKEHSIIEEKAYRDTWGNGLNSYLQMMYERLVLMKELLAENGSIYVHLDWHVGHYVKVMMDEIFGYENFRNEIVWRYRRWPSPSSDFQRMHDTILRYSKTKNFIWNQLYEERAPSTLKTYGNKRIISKRKATGEKVLRATEETSLGVNMSDVWEISYIQGSASEERAQGGYFATQKPEALLERIILASSNPGDIVADFFCGSGTTLAVAEKLGRRWIGCDLSRYAIHVTRKRLLEIENSKDLESSDRKYGKKAKPFEILNLGKYERQLWQIKTFTGKDEKQIIYEYIVFILKLYGAEPISGFTYIHGKKGNALVYVGAVDYPVTIQEVIDVMNECKKVGQKELHILGWEWEMGLNDAIQEIAKREDIKLRLRIIPKEVLDEEAIRKGDIQFFELAYFRTDIKTSGKTVELELKDFVIPHTDLIPDNVKDMIRRWTDWIDYWAVDFDFKNDTFNNGWTSYRTKKDRTLNLQATHTYQAPGKYKIFVKVIDIFGIDTSQIFEVEV